MEAAVRYLSLFSGIESASVAWGPLGWEPVAFAEIDPFPCAVLEERYPGVPNLGDVSEVDWRKFVKRSGKPDVLVGGSPCQSFSIAGSRTGLDGASGLMWEYVRAVREVRPRWVLWENVPGALSSSHGEDFRCLLEALDALGYGLAWRVLDAQFFGLAQRRERVFLVGRLGERPPVEVLFEPESVPWDPRSSREKREDLAEAAGRRPEGASFTLKLRHTGSDNPGGGAGPLVQRDVSATLATSQDQTLFSFAQESDVMPALDASGSKAVCIADDNANAAVDVDMAGTIKVGGSAPIVSSCRSGVAVRRLTPTECERLQGFPTEVRLKAEDMTPDELIACALANGDITCDLANGKVYGTRGPGGKPLDEKRELGFVHPSGYVHINLSSNGSKKQVRAHRVIYIAANGHIPDGMVVDHINNDKSDNRICNLQLLTAEENSRKAADDGKYLSGEDNPQSKITAEVRSRIAHDYRTLGMTYRDLAQKYGVSKSRIGQIVNECDWTLIPYRGKPAEECPDGPRYKALGNSMAVPVMRWIGERIGEAERGGLE